MQEEINEICLFTKCSSQREKNSASVTYVDEKLSDWTGKRMKERHPLLFIGACQIAVRAIAPWVSDKLFDPPVLVMDERGNHIIPLLSGHIGGANALADKLSERLGAKAVITTATDIEGRFAVDLFAKKNSLHIANRDGIAKVSAKVLAGEEIKVAVEPEHVRTEEKMQLPEGLQLVSGALRENADVVISSQRPEKMPLLFLQSKEYVIGMGCRRGKEKEKIGALIEKTLKEAGITKSQVFALASIDCKKEEEGFLTWTKEAGVLFLVYPAKELMELKGRFCHSEFVEKQVGADNVCERAALKACREGGVLVYEKHAEDGMTIAVAKREWSVTFGKTKN